MHLKEKVFQGRLKQILYDDTVSFQFSPRYVSVIDYARNFNELIIKCGVDESVCKTIGNKVQK